MRRRKIIQLLSLILFLASIYLLNYTNPFLRIDPLVNFISFAAGSGTKFIMLFLIFFLIIFIFGNIFCDYICPLRTCFDYAHLCLKHLIKLQLNIKVFKKLKFIILILLILLFIFHKQLFFLFDPIVILTRAFTFNTLPPIILLLVIIILSGLSYRFWCNYFCPLGSLISIFLQTRKLVPKQKQKQQVDFVTRRELIKALFLLPMQITLATKMKIKHRLLLRPPGSVEEDLFILGCLRCGACIKICPTKVIEPAKLYDGIENFWSPKLVYAKSYCAFDNCFLCYKVCPTGVIRAPHYGKKIKIGVAKVKRENCLVWSKNISCYICEEVCPKNAVYRASDFEPITGQQTTGPAVNEEICVGCGLCENRCPALPKAITVHPEGEIRAY